MAQEITPETPVNIHLLQTNSNANIGVRFVEPESQFAMDETLAERTSNMMAANEYRSMHPKKDEEFDENAPFHLLQTNSNLNLGVRFVEQESQFAMYPALAERTSALIAANEYRSMHPNKDEEISEDAPFHLVQTGFVGDEGIDNRFAGQLAQALENNEVRTQNFSQVDSTDDFGHLYDDLPNEMVQTGFVTEKAQNAPEPDLPQ